MNKFTKKAMAVNVAVMMVVALLSGFISFSYITSTSDLVSTSAQDNACKTFVAAQGSTTGSLLIFLADLKLKCKTEKLEIKGETEDKIFTNVANSMDKCWNRYGKGEHDFLGSFGTEGNWCFACAKLTFEDETKDYSYTNSFIPWTKENGKKLSNGTKLTYHDILNLKYYNGDEQLLVNLSQGISEIDSLIQDGDPSLTSLVVSMSEKNLELINLAQKRIISDEEMYVVYRYDRIPKEMLEIIGDIAIGFTAGIVLESVLFWGVGALITVATLGTAGPVVVAVGAYKTGQKFNKAQKTKKAYGIAEKLISSTGKAIKLSQKSKTLKIIGNFDGTLKSTILVGNKLNKIDPKFADEFIELSSKLSSMGITHIDDIPKMIAKNEKAFDNLQEITLKAIDSGLIKNKGITKVVNIQQKQLTEINDLKDLKSDLEKIKSLKDLSDKNKAGAIEQTTSAIRNLFRLGGGLIGATGAAAYNSNNIQYVDLLNKEQYYRLCGTEPIITK
jgi:hypothetical protein